jgi:uncharacterized protein YbaR (Trm112 family)
MTISPKILEILACPVCRKPVRLLPDQTGLTCDECKRLYPIRDDIPVMMPEEATIVLE